MPQVVTSIRVPAPPAAVWRVLTDFAAYEQWNPFMLSMGGDPVEGARLKLRFTLRPGARVTSVGATVLRVVPESELRWGGGPRGLLHLEHWVRMAADGDGTLVEHGESFEGLLGGLVFRVVGVTSAPYDAMNAALVRRVTG